MKRIVACLFFIALLLPEMAMGAQSQPDALRVLAPAFSYHTFGTEAGELVRLTYERADVAGELFVLEDGYLSIAYEQEDDVLYPYPAQKPLTFLNNDLSVRWILKEERLTGAWYTDLLELPEALVLGPERSPPGVGQVYSLMMIEKDTGAIRWQAEGEAHVGNGLVWIGRYRADANGNILVGSSGDLFNGKDGAGTLSLLSNLDGSLLWAEEYRTEYGMIFVSDLCRLGEGWLVYGKREEDSIILYVDSKGTAQGYFTFRPWDADLDHTFLWLLPTAEDAVYLGGWEREGMAGEAKEPYLNRTLYLMRITEETFQGEYRP